MDGAATPAAVVRVKAGRTADKRRSWHVARLASDIQRSIQQSQDQSPATATTPTSSTVGHQSRSSWHSNEDWSSPYRTGWTTTTKPDSGGNSDQVVHQDKPSFSIASWADRPSNSSAPIETMDAAFAHYTTAPEPVPHPQYQVQQHSNGSSGDDSQDELDREPPIFLVPVSLMDTNDPDDLNHHKRLVSTISDNYIDVVVKELRGVPHPSNRFQITHATICPVLTIKHTIVVYLSSCPLFKPYTSVAIT